MISADMIPITASSSSPSQSLTSSSPANLHYAFLVHSQKTLTQNLPPRVDNKLLARQKRRRTSPEDHAILEAEYKKNPKPDKAARASIVSRVSLGEKEVQIWFQNRRQNDRRKSKPLEPHELVGPRASDGISDDSPSNHDISSPHDGEQATPELSEGIISRNDDALADPLHNNELDDLEADTQPGYINPETSFSSINSANFGEEMEQSREIVGLGIQVNGKKRRLSETEVNQRKNDRQEKVKSPPSLRISLSSNGEALLRKQGESTPSPPKARTAVRISLSSDGEALIRTQDEPSPSKNRLRLIPGRVSRQTGLRRSVSAINFGSPGATPLIRDGNGMKPFGRSRDARMWESYCDNDARSALSAPISSQPSSGARTPGLYRSGSHRSLARHSFSKPNLSSPAIGTASQLDVAEPSREKRRKLSRTVSSLGRLESVHQTSIVTHTSTSSLKSTNKAGKEGVERLDLEAGDSDKENWVPGTYRRASPRRHQRAKSHTQRPVLKENGIRRNTVVDDLALTKQGRLYRGPRGTKGASQTTATLDAEVAAFMTKTGSSSREEDLDCIQGLLSLSQGAWQ
ncbi:homeobox transcription factor, putative [Talaromyces stipitatus ATCC 10500]|uniref:Homeobox transcription factor, putative n=1 Tax=Talaromyces stipitatus (strain ATCC 10500 / CBS 375.48 / QM 6759 / NRRL 1006) TaxID=441959 RepID=B8LZL3_TALSN|nr:homeobox transcription factor, putative [Talaromyces stipitatus ATCC 10500]EED22436.1 homeobox transcription factor, putative [Talaromyces stipitatus ATCC 10500]